MDYNEWVFLISSKEDVNHVLTLVKLHNICDFGEQISVGAMLYRKKTNRYYLYLSNCGGCDCTTAFFQYNSFSTITKNKKTIFYPFEQPAWFRKEKEMSTFWQSETREEAMNPEEYIKTPWDV